MAKKPEYKSLSIRALAQSQGKTLTFTQARVKPVEAFAELFEHLAGVASDSRTEILPKHVARIFRELLPVAYAHLANKKIGRFKIPGLMTVVRKDVAAKKVPAQKGGEKKKKKNPFTGEMFITEKKAAYTKPATVRVKGRPASILKRSLIEAL